MSGYAGRWPNGVKGLLLGLKFYWLYAGLLRIARQQQLRQVREFRAAGAIFDFPHAVELRLTDIADYPPHFWIEDVDQHVICGSERAARQAAELGIPGDRILRVSGMILHPRFYSAATQDRRTERRAMGFEPDRPTGLVLFGGEGSGEMLHIARALNDRGGAIQLIFLCGHNEEVADRLRAIDWHIPVQILGFTRNIPRFMELADFFIGKPGPGSISEALAKRLPVIVQRKRLDDGARALQR